VTHDCERHQPSTACYHTHRCRCDGCLEAKRLYVKRNGIAVAKGRPALVPAGRTIAHVRRLVAAGMSLRQIERASGVGAGRMPDILIAKTVQRRTAAAILATPIGRLPSCGYVNSIGVKRRVRALQAIGWPVAQISLRLGKNERSLRNTLTLGEVYTDTHRAVRDLYEAMADERPAEDTADQRRQVTRAKNYAAARGWPPPAAWDLDIDEPDAEPSMPAGSSVGLAAAEVAHLLGSESAEAIAARLGYLSVDNLANTVGYRDKPLADKLRATQMMKAVA